MNDEMAIDKIITKEFETGILKELIKQHTNLNTKDYYVKVKCYNISEPIKRDIESYIAVIINDETLIKFDYNTYYTKVLMKLNEKYSEYNKEKFIIWLQMI